jgi:TRAP-type mannitol/chloroaromatic compound transport system substrate-binding protein
MGGVCVWGIYRSPKKERKMTDILVNKGQWDALPKEEQDKIIKGLRETGAIYDTDEIVGDDSVSPIDENTQLQPMWNPLKDACRALCDVAAAAALGWCATHTAGTGLAVCVAIAEKARTRCKNNC